MQWLKTFFEENPGFASSFRFVLIYGFVWLTIYCSCALFVEKVSFGEIATFFVEVTALLLGLKTASKQIESKTPPKLDNSKNGNDAKD